MPSRKELKQIALTRMKEVEILYSNRLYDGALYLSGYVVETALKARVCRILDNDYPDSGEVSKSFLTHKFDILIKLGGLQKTLDREMAANLRFKTNWSLATSSWSEAYRYRAIGSGKKTDVEDMIDALVNRNNGILNWIKKRW